MNLSDIGEFDLIERLDTLLKKAGVAATQQGSDSTLLIGIGDDAAVWRTNDGVVQLSTTDTMVDGVHFTHQTTPWRDLGWKAMVSNLSDIAAMGGMPTFALVTLGLRKNLPVSDIEEAYQGIIEACRQYDTVVAGGDLVESPSIFITISMQGLHSGTPLKRSAACSGDLLAVTGALGASLGGLELMHDQIDVPSGAGDSLRRAHRRPVPRLAEGLILTKEGILAAMDISDGLVDDLRKMMTASGTAADLDTWLVPVDPSLQRAFPGRSAQMALTGGEDYHLLYSAPQSVMERTLARIPDAVIIGRVLTGPPGQVTVRDQEGNQLPGMSRGWDHFRP